MKKLFRLSKIALATLLALFITQQVVAVVSYHFLSDEDKCAVRKHVELGNKPWDDKYWRDNDRIERVCLMIYGKE